MLKNLSFFPSSLYFLMVLSAMHCICHKTRGDLGKKSPSTLSTRALPSQIATTAENNDIVCLIGPPPCPVPCALVMDVDTGQVLYGKNIYRPTRPSSLTKIVFVDLLFQELSRKGLTFGEKIWVSPNASHKEGSRMFLKSGQEVSVDDLLKGIIVQSGNDACCALAEHLYGSEEEGGRKITAHIKSLGGKKSNFINTTGLPHPGHYSTCWDLAVVANHTLKTFPKLYQHYYKMPCFTFNGIRQDNRNELVRKGWADGLKTGKTDAGGFGIALSRKEGKNGRRMLLILNGATSNQQRHEVARQLMEWGMRQFIPVSFFQKGAKVCEIKVWNGALKDTLFLTPIRNIALSIPRRFIHQTTVTIYCPNWIIPPIKKGDVLGDVHIQWSQGDVAGPVFRFPLIAMEDVKSATLWQQLCRWKKTK